MLSHAATAVTHINDSVACDPLLTVPIPSTCELGIGSASLCFEIHGKKSVWVGPHKYPSGLVVCGENYLLFYILHYCHS